MKREKVTQVFFCQWILNLTAIAGFGFKNQSSKSDNGDQCQWTLRIADGTERRIRK
jgi:hypothetical protein